MAIVRLTPDGKIDYIEFDTGNGYDYGNSILRLANDEQIEYLDRGTMPTSPRLCPSCLTHGRYNALQPYNTAVVNPSQFPSTYANRTMREYLTYADRNDRHLIAYLASTSCGRCGLSWMKGDGKVVEAHYYATPFDEGILERL